jgi:hypothetical protein
MGATSDTESMGFLVLEITLIEAFLVEQIILGKLVFKDNFIFEVVFYIICFVVSRKVICFNFSVFFPVFSDSFPLEPS